MVRMGSVALAVVVMVLAGGAESTQTWEEEPGYREVNPGGAVVMVCRVRDKRGECRWERDNTPIAAFPGKYEWAGERSEGDCSLRILQANIQYDSGGWVCQVTASSFKQRDTLISRPANLVVRGNRIVQNHAESSNQRVQTVCLIFAQLNLNLIIEMLHDLFSLQIKCANMKQIWKNKYECKDAG